MNKAYENFEKWFEANKKKESLKCWKLEAWKCYQAGRMAMLTEIESNCYCNVTGSEKCMYCLVSDLTVLA